MKIYEYILLNAYNKMTHCYKSLQAALLMVNIQLFYVYKCSLKGTHHIFCLHQKDPDEMRQVDAVPVRAATVSEPSTSDTPTERRYYPDSGSRQADKWRVRGQGTAPLGL